MSLIWIVNILSVFFLCVFFAGIVIPQILLIAFRRRLFDEPDERKIHQCVVPRLGGMAFKPIYAVFPERHAALCGESEKR